jgi:protein subunit release factor A
MIEALDAGASQQKAGSINADRKGQVGTGQRSDRRRTWAFQRDSVDDYITGRSTRCQQALKGFVDQLWPAESQKADKSIHQPADCERSWGF